MTDKLHKAIEESLEYPDNSWSKRVNEVARLQIPIPAINEYLINEPSMEQYIQQMEAIQGPEDWERLLGIQCDHEGMHQLLFTENGDVRHVNGYQEGKRL